MTRGALVQGAHLHAMYQQDAVRIVFAADARNVPLFEAAYDLEALGRLRGGSAPWALFVARDMTGRAD